MPLLLARKAALGAGLVFAGLVWTFFSLFFDPSILNPQSIGWIAEGDLRQHYLGWVALRQADSLGQPWGTAPLLAYPHGAPISSTDSNPLVSLILWPFSNLLPADFQFIGPWYLVSLSLGLAFGTALMRQAGFDRFTALLLGGVLAFQPVLFWRYGHDTLTAQWLILAAFYVALAVTRPARAMAAHGGLLVLAMAIHPYLFVMLNFVVGFDILARVLRAGGLRFGVLERAVLALIAVEAVALFVGGKLGVFSLSTPSGNAIGVHSADPLGFFNPFDASRLMPQLPAGPGQYEGFAYLGLGGLGLVLASTVLALRGHAAQPSWGRLWPVLAAGLAAYAFAVLPVVTLFGTEIFRLNLGLEGALSGVYEKLRSSGRFVWITVYAVCLLALLCLPRAARWRVRMLAVTVLALQVWDLEPLRARSLADTAPRALPASVLDAPDWQDRIARADYVYLSRGLGLEFSLEVGAVAFPLGTPLSWFYTAQGLGLPEQIAVEEQLRLRVLNGGHDQTALYLLDPGFEQPLVHRNAAGIVSTRAFGAFASLDTAAFAPKLPLSHDTHGLTELLETCLVDCTAVLVAKDRVTQHLSPQLGAWLTQRGSRILEVRDSWGYGLILRDGTIEGEALTPDTDATLNALVADRALSLRSSVTDASVPMSITLDGVEYARDQTGLNLLLVHDDGQIVSAVFDTSRQSDSILPDGGAGTQEMSLATLADPSLVPPLVERLIAAVPGPISGAAPTLSVGRLLSQDASLLDVLSRCRQDCAMAISVKDEASANLPFAVRRLAAQMGLTLAELSYRDGYGAIVANGVVLVQGRSRDETVDVAETVNGTRIRVRSAGFEAGNMTAIEVAGKDVALGHRGLNIAVLFPGGESISYHFDTHGGS